MEEQCAAHGGLFIPSRPIVPRSPPIAGQCQISLAQERAIDLCRSSNSQWVKGAYRTYYCFNPRLKQDCVAKGGNWQPEGMAGIPGCVMTAIDAGRVCKDGSECQFKLCTYKGAQLEPGTYEEKNTKATFIIEIQKPSTSSEKISFTKGAIRRVAGSQPDLFMKSLSIALGGKGKIPITKRVNRLPLELAVLGIKQSRVSHDGGFTSKPAGDWIVLKAFLANGDGEVYLNLNPEKGVGEFSLKDEGYAEVVLREVASVL
jgi:hypothetical protein